MNPCWIIRGLLLLNLIGVQSYLFAQQPNIRVSFYRQNNFTYSTQFDTQYQFEKESYSLSLNLHHDNLFNTSRRGDPFVQLYLSSDIWQYWRLNDFLEISSWIETDQFFNANNERYSAYVGLRFKWKDWLNLTPLIGYSWDYRSMIWDEGLSPGIAAQARYVWPDGLSMETQAFARVKFIDPRHQRNIRISSIWTKSISKIADFAFGANLGSNEMDDYVVSWVEKIHSDTLSPFFNFRYQIQPNLYWDSNNRLSYTRRRFEYVRFRSDSLTERNNLSFNHIDLETQQRLSFSQKKWLGYIQYTYQSLNRRYELEQTEDQNSAQFEVLEIREKRKDFFRRLQAFELGLQYIISPRHTLFTNATNRYIQHDTPSEDNFDDHDELIYSTSFGWRAQWSRNFFTEYELIGNVRQYAFLFRERSQDNYTQRSLRLNFTYNWDILPRLRMRGLQYIYVTYNVKDFEDVNQTDRSTRNLESRIELMYRPKPRWDLNLSLYRKEFHVSFLNWEAFSETTLDTTVTYILEQKTSYQLKNRLKKKYVVFLDFGYKHFQQFRKTNSSMLNIDNFLVPINLTIRNIQTGFTSGIRIRERSPASIDLSVWWQIQYQDFLFNELEQGQSAGFGIRYRETDLTRKSTFFRPFFKLRLNFWLRSPVRGS